MAVRKNVRFTGLGVGLNLVGAALKLRMCKKSEDRATRLRSVQKFRWSLVTFASKPEVSSIRYVNRFSTEVPGTHSQMRNVVGWNFRLIHRTDPYLRHDSASWQLGEIWTAVEVHAWMAHCFSDHACENDGAA